MTDTAISARAPITAIIDRAAKALTSATTAAEVLEARDIATEAYDAAKRIARFVKAKEAHDEVIAAVYRAQADALLIESQAKARLADEYDAAQERGEVAAVGKPINVPGGNNKPTAEDIGLTRKQIHEARQIRDAEKAAPGIAEKALQDRLAKGEEPTRAALKRDIGAVAKSKREARQAENARGREETAAQFSPAVQEHRARSEEYRARAKAEKSKPTGDADALRAEIEEKVEYIASLEAENADLKRQIAKFDDMAVQYEQGGFEKVIAGKDEEIRVLETRLYSTNADMISWRKKAAWETKEKLRYKQEAEARGYSDAAGETNPDNGEAVDEYTVF